MYVVYYRTSTDGQDLGIESQKQIVRRYLKGKTKLLAEFEEQVSAKKADNRQQLKKALEYARANNATLVVAKLDRLSRSILDIVKLKEESGVNIEVVENAELFNSPLMLAVHAGVAQHKRELISQRTKAALAVLKEKGVKLGNPNRFCPAARESSVETRRAHSKKNNSTNDQLILIYKKNGLSEKQITDILLSKGVKTPQGSEPHRSYVYRRLHCITNGQSDVQWT